MSSFLTVTVFDLDDTLYPELEYAESGLVHVGEALEQRHGCTGLTDALLAELEGGGRHRIFNAVLPKFGLSLDLIPQLVADYRAHKPEISLFPEAKAVIRQAMDRGPVALITDGPAQCQRQKIDALKIAPFFDLIIVTDEMGSAFWKPHPRAYEKVMQTFGVEGVDCLYIGDNPTKDFVTAKALGWRTVYVKRPGQMYEHDISSPDHKAHRQVDSLKGIFD